MASFMEATGGSNIFSHRPSIRSVDAPKSANLDSAPVMSKVCRDGLFCAYNRVHMSAPSELEIAQLLHTETVTLRNVRCSGTCRHRSEEESTSATYLVFPYRGVYLRHVGSDQTV